MSKTILIAILVIVFLFSEYIFIPCRNQGSREARFLLPGFEIFAQENLEEICLWEKIEKQPENLSKEDYESLLKKCQVYYKQKSKEIENDITKTEQEKKSLSNQIYILSNKIKNLDYQIYQGNIMIKDLGSQIGETLSSIDKTNLKIEDIKENLSNILQLRYEEDQISPLEIFLAEENLSNFFDNLMALEALNSETQELLKNIKNLKSNLEGQKEFMDEEKKDLENLVTIQTLQKQESAEVKGQQENFLNMTEAEYQKQLKEKQESEETATKIGNLLFELLEVPEGGIKFEDAVRITKEISKQTGVRVAFSLAVLWQETRIGKLKGGCYLNNTETGDGIYIKTGNKAPRTMKPEPWSWSKFSDTYFFPKIIAELNKSGKIKTDAFHTPVSCCMILDNGSYFGWGGAMGPAQFIPNTWMLYNDEIEKKTGDVPANPWNVRDAFLANSLYLKDLGASVQTYEKEIYAALRYFGCTNLWCRKNYGEPIMTVAKCIQDYTDKGSMSASCEKLVF